MKEGNISVQSENIFPIIKQFLYSDQEIFLREIVANAVDATQKLKTLHRKGQIKGDLGDLTIDIILDKENKTLTIRDRGIGMTEEEVVKYLNQVAFSSAQEFLDKYEDDAQVIGHFGLGFYSAFMVADEVTVETRSYKVDSDAVKWVCEGNPEYKIGDADKEERGTDVIIKMAEDAEEYLEKNRIQELLDTYAKFLPIEIRFGKKEETYTEGEGEDAETKTREVDNIVNNPNPIWKKQATELEDSDYKDFYNELYPMAGKPLFWIHLNIDYPFNLTGILYFPRIQNNLEVQKNKIHLYSNQVYVTDEVKDIVPEFLTLLHGVIDSPDIPLNVSRSYLQSDRNVKKISSYITKKVADKLYELFKEDRDDYTTKWDQINVFVKYGMISEDKFYDKAQKFALLKDVEGNHYTIDEFKDKVKDNQTDKHDKIVMIYANDKETQMSYIKSAENYGYEVLEFDTVIDNHFIQHLEQQQSSLTFVRVDSESPDQLVQKDEDRESVMSESEIEKVQEIFKSQFENKEIQMKALSPEDNPVMIVKPEFMRRMQEMQKIQGVEMGNFPDHFNVIINTNHDLIAQKLVRMRSEDKKVDFVNHLFNIALLNQGMLKGEKLAEFVNQSFEFLKK